VASSEKQVSAELLAAASGVLADVYEVDELGFLMAVESGTDFTQRQSLSQFFEVGRSFPALALKISELYSALLKSKQARATLATVEPTKLELPVEMGFMAHLDDNPYTKFLLEDVLAARLPNPTTPSSASIGNEIVAMRKELYSTGTSRITTTLIMERILEGKLSLGRNE